MFNTGQFWNIPASVTQYTGFLRDGTTRDDAYIVEIRPPNKPARRFVGFFNPYGWDHSHQNCIYVGDSNAGQTYELLSVNDPVIEGDYTFYRMDSHFNTTYQFSEFDESSVCKIIS